MSFVLPERPLWGRWARARALSLLLLSFPQRFAAGMPVQAGSGREMQRLTSRASSGKTGRMPDSHISPWSHWADGGPKSSEVKAQFLTLRPSKQDPLCPQDRVARPLLGDLAFLGLPAGCYHVWEWLHWLKTPCGGFRYSGWCLSPTPCPAHQEGGQWHHRTGGCFQGPCPLPTSYPTSQDPGWLHFVQDGGVLGSRWDSELPESWMWPGEQLLSWR